MTFLLSVFSSSMLFAWTLSTPWPFSFWYRLHSSLARPYTAFSLSFCFHFDFFPSRELVFLQSDLDREWCAAFFDCVFFKVCYDLVTSGENTLGFISDASEQPLSSSETSSCICFTTTLYLFPIHFKSLWFGPFLPFFPLCCRLLLLRVRRLWLCLELPTTSPELEESLDCACFCRVFIEIICNRFQSLL